MTFELNEEVTSILEVMVNADQVFVTLSKIGDVPVFVVMVEDEGSDGDPVMAPVAIVVTGDVFDVLEPPTEAPVALDVAEGDE